MQRAERCSPLLAPARCSPGGVGCRKSSAKGLEVQSVSEGRAGRSAPFAMGSAPRGSAGISAGDRQQSSASQNALEQQTDFQAQFDTEQSLKK